MAHKQVPCSKYEFVVTPNGPKILPVDEPSCKSEESPADYNSGGYLPVKVKDTFKHGRYKVIRKLGWGHFSTVWLARDYVTNRHSALKVVKSAGRYAETARDEIKLLSKVQSFSPSHPGRAHIVSFLDSFNHQGPEATHICIVFEPLGENLLALIERNKKKGVSRPLVRVIARQILLGLQYLHDECDLVHTDIKPENIMISIPDVESHISTELSQSPTPTSRRVGVPLPNKTRSGVAIPLSQQRASRRQVQIFDSQPLSSPGRSAGSNQLSLASAAAGINHPQTSSSSKGVITPSPGTSFVPQKSSLLSMSAPKPPTPEKEQSAASAESPVHSSPSTSSSTSSLASSGFIGNIPGSVISTPPTSVANSLTSAIMMGAGLLSEPAGGVYIEVLPVQDRETKGIPLGPKRDKLKESLPFEHSTSWRERLGLSSSSWKGRTLSSSWKSSQSNEKSKTSQGNSTHSRSGSSQISASWKDPGLAAPAPAVVVSATALADTEGRSGFDFGEEPSHPLTSSLSATASSSSTDISNVSSSSDTTITHHASPSPESDLTPASQSTSAVAVGKVSRANPPSLLSQTAPRQQDYASSEVHISRQSPQHNISQLSAHMHALSSSLSSPDSSVSPGFADITPTASPALALPSSLSTSTSVSPMISSPLARGSGSISDSPIAPAPPPPPTLIPLDVTPVTPTLPPITIKIADLGNATPSTRHFTEDIQTRQYRAPEAIIGRKDWDARADMWSVACVLFELLTAEYLFDPQSQGELFTKDDDHMAQIIELLGDFELEVKMGGKYSRELFDSTGSLRYIKSLKPWPLKRVMMEKYLFTDADATALCEFLTPMLETDMRKRCHAREMINHPWLEPTTEPVGDW